MGSKRGHSWNVLTEKIGRTVLTFGLTLWVPRLLPEWSSKQTVVGIRIYNKQFKGTTFSMVLDVQVWFPWCKQQYLATIMQPVYFIHPSILLFTYLHPPPLLPCILFQTSWDISAPISQLFWGPGWSNFGLWCWKSSPTLHQQRLVFLFFNQPFGAQPEASMVYTWWRNSACFLFKTTGFVWSWKNLTKNTG